MTAAPLHIPSVVYFALCEAVSDTSDTASLTQLARSSHELRDAAIPTLYRRITLTKTNIIPFFATPSLASSSWRYTTHLRIASIPNDLPPALNLLNVSSPPLFPNIHTITIDSEAIWELIVHSHAHTTPHPLVSFLITHASPKNLVIHYPNAERTAHSFGGGYCCCFAAIRAFQQNPLRAAAFDRSSSARLISSLAGQWKLESMELRGVVDDQLPLSMSVGRLEVQWEACQCADEKFGGEWCFNHVSPLKRVEQVKELLAWGAEKNTEVTMSGVEKVGGWCDIEDVGKWIDDRLAEGQKEHVCCTLKSL